MKTKNYLSKIAKVAMAFYATLFLVNCSNNSGGGGTTANTSSYYQMIGTSCYLNANGAVTVTSSTYCSGTNPYYRMNGTACYLNSNGTQTPVSSTYCATTGTYQLINGRCYQGSIEVAPTYCQGTTGNYTTAVCTGWYRDDYQTVNCGVQMSCSGYTLMNVATQTITICQ